MSDIAVSICVLTYNHAKYLRKCLDSMLMQKTNFRFEIIVHDDASTDDTQSILLEYREKHPQIINLILQKENLHSQGVKRIFHIPEKQAVGKYIALCEGDDFWIDENKLQKQYDFMENNPDCSLCIHGVKTIYENDSNNVGYIRHKGSEGYISLTDVIKINQHMTSAKFYRRELRENYPDYYFNALWGDYPQNVYFAASGKVYYLDEFMSMYRLNVPNSAITSAVKTDENRIKASLRFLTMLDEMDAYYNYKYKKAFDFERAWRFYRICFTVGNIKDIKKDYGNIYYSLPIKYRIFININFLSPSLYSKLTALRRKILLKK